MKYVLTIGLVLALFLGGEAYAAAATMDQEQVLGIEASAKFMKRDLRGAESIYTRILGMNNGNIDATLQRGLVRRELGNAQGAQADAQQALKLIDAQLAQNQNADLYYQRSLADRLLRQFDAAEQDLNQAIRLGKRGNFETDFKSIALERKMAQ